MVLSAHPDDAQLGCGATIHRLARIGADIRHIVFSDCKANVPRGFRRGKVLEECRAADAILGVAETEILDVPVRHFPENRQQVLQIIFDCMSEFDVIFCPWEFDRHQDHEVVAKETLRATKNQPLVVLQYELPANCPGFVPTVFIEVSEEDAEAKYRALSQFETQKAKRKRYFERRFWQAQLTIRGGQCSLPLAEGFAMYRGVARLK